MFEPNKRSKVKLAANTTVSLNIGSNKLSCVLFAGPQWSLTVLYFYFIVIQGKFAAVNPLLFPLSSVLQQQNNEVHFRLIFPAFPAA